MAPNKKSGPPELSSKRDLVVHSYDTFLISQTRLFTLANSIFSRECFEIEEKKTILFLDDLLVFSIAARRLIELTLLRSFANRCKIGQSRIDWGATHDAAVPISDNKIGFLTFVSSVIHCQHLMLVTNRLQRPPSEEDRTEKGIYARYSLVVKIDREQRWAEYSIDPTFLVVPDKGTPFTVRLKDVITQSVKVAEKIRDVCAKAEIYLEQQYRGGS